MTDLNTIAEHWQQQWEESKIFEANPSGQKKFFINFPYPYINSYLHLGHAFSITRVDVMARYKRMQGFNVLFPQGWHCTGTPVWAAAQRVREREPKQLKILGSLGFSEGEIEKFSDVKHWIDVFVPAAQKDLQRLGASVDWRRSFITTDLNPHYDAFIRWQFRKLLEKGYVQKGKHPVVWCPKDLMPVGDHDRVEGEGETPQEYSLLKFKFADGFIIAATLRPETVFGQTNLWVNPDVTYVKASVDSQIWIISPAMIEKLRSQGHQVEMIKEIPGTELIGKYCTAPMIKKEIMILPADFVTADIGTGLVTSVPGDAPYDYVALRDLQQDTVQLKKYGISADEVKKIKPIPIITSKELGNLPAVKVVEEMKIKNQHDSKLDQATAIVYKAGFYGGVMNANCGRYAGMAVTAAKDAIKKELAQQDVLEKFYELSGNVVCRCLTKCIVRIVSDQWFLAYGNEQWKENTRTALSSMKLYPELVRAQFNHVIGWLNDWACTHHHGTGTKLPWDESWVIESLSDSTIYMAYYTIAHKIKDIVVSEITDEFFDYIFLGKGSLKQYESLRTEFEYWYPFDVRSSGKDLIQNHLSFCLFNHTAIFPQKYWPRSFSINGWLLVEGEKMSKSRGNFFTIRQVVDTYGADVVRAGLMLGGEGLNDPNFDMNTAKSLTEKLEGWLDFVRAHSTSAAQNEMTLYDRILLSAVHRLLKDGSAAMEQMLFRTAFDLLFFQMQRAIKEYVRRGNLNPAVLTEVIAIQTKVLAPFCPFTAEEAWHQNGHADFVSVAGWPLFDERKIDVAAEAQVALNEEVGRDIIEVLRLAKIARPKKITIIIASAWMYDFVQKLKDALLVTRNQGEITKQIMQGDFKKYGNQIMKLLPRLLKDESKIPQVVLSSEIEFKSISLEQQRLEKEFGCVIEILPAEKSQHPKAAQALPAKPAIVVK